MKSWFSIANLAADTAEVRIYDEIGAYGVSAKSFCADFNAIKAAKIDLRINSGGGDVFDAFAICTAIKEHPADVTAHVDGLAASAASVIAAACDSVEMGQSSFMMIHNPMSIAFGDAADMRKQADVLDKLADSIAGVYADKTGKPKEDVRKAMDAESWYDADEATEYGLADKIKEDDGDEDEEDEDDPTDALKRPFNSLSPLLLGKFKNVPQRILLAAARNQTSQPEPEAPSMLKIINRDGKHFVAVGGKEEEIELPPQMQITNTTVKTGKSDDEVATLVNAAKAEAVKQERDYRAMFTTVIASANLAGDAAAKFEKEFYGRPESDLKFLASHAIGARAVAVGEGSGEPENQGTPDQKEIEKQKTEIVAYCAGRFAKESSLRRTYKVNNANPESAEYKAGLARYIAVETKCRADEARKGPAEEESTGDDAIGRILKNKTVCSE